MQRMPGWFRAVFITVMFFTCAILCWYAASQYQLQFQIADLSLSLETSRGREIKQQYEYDQVAAQLPLVEEQVALLEPQAAAAQAVEKELRAQRKTLRAENAELAQKLEALQAQVEQLQEEERLLREEVDALRRQLQQGI